MKIHDLEQALMFAAGLVEPPAPRSVPIDHLASTYSELRRVNEAMDILKARRTQLEKPIRDAIGESPVGTIGGIDVVSWASTERSTISTKLLKERYPTIAHECTVVTPVRTFRVLDLQ